MSNSFITNVNTLVNNLDVIETASSILTPEVVASISSLNPTQILALHASLSSIIAVHSNISTVTAVGNNIEDVVQLAGYLSAMSGPTIIQDLIAIHSKLNSIEDNANNYVHPEKHDVSIINGEGFNNQFVKSSDQGVTEFAYITWGDVINKPVAYTPSTHTHTMEDFVTGSLDANRIQETLSRNFVTRDQLAIINDAEVVSRKGVPNGYAPLDSNGKINPSFINDLNLLEVFTPYNNESMLNLSTANPGDVAVVQDTGLTFMLIGLPSNIQENWKQLNSGGGVLSFNGLTGVVNVSTDDISEGHINKYFTEDRTKNVIATTVESGSNILTEFDPLAGKMIISSPDSVQQNTINNDNDPSLFIGHARKEWSKGLTAFTGMLAIEITGLYEESNMLGTMLVHILEVSDDNHARLLHINGKWDSSSNEWTHGVSTDLLGQSALTVRFAKNTTNNKTLILIGDIYTSWNNTRVAIEVPLSSYNPTLNLGFDISALNNLTNLTFDIVSDTYSNVNGGIY